MVPSTNFTYSGIRTFYRPHPQQSKLPREPCPVPLLVFIHGLGGSVAQFHPILLSLTNLASCLAIDLPGCGLSEFEPKNWGAYTTDALVQLLAVVIEAHRAVDDDQQVVLVGHSMGCSLATLLASPSSPHAQLLSSHVAGLIAICPRADPLSKEEMLNTRRAASMPVFLLDLFRKWDRRGGINSKSVLRMTGAGADEETRRLQLRFNKQSRTPVWQRMVSGMCSSRRNAGLPGRETWAGLQIPTFLAGGEADAVTAISNVRRILDFLGRDVAAIEPPSEKASLPIAAAPFDPVIIGPASLQRKHQDSGIDASDLPKLTDDATTASPTTDSFDIPDERTTTGSISTADASLISDVTKPSSNSPEPHPRRLVVKTAIMPSPAAHSLLFAPSTSRIISGLIGSFFADHIDPRLSLAWQLQYLSTEGKWDVKNLEKWQAVRPISEPIAGVFRAMKTLREVDEEHTPKVLAQKWAGKICAVIDISHDNPVYDPKGLEEGGIPYHKFPTVSKQPPQADEVKVFMDLVDKIRSEKKPGLIAVHCHYGFNRTGFFLVSYLIERCGYKVEDAIDHFQQQRPPGIRHSHFIDTLHVRYCHGLKKAPTL
jgi:pimeloyl-ACP methyl ester carboxylesterase/protein-tyrosine phosphatase